MDYTTISWKWIAQWRLDVRDGNRKKINNRYWNAELLNTVAQKYLSANNKLLTRKYTLRQIITSIKLQLLLIPNIVYKRLFDLDKLRTIKYVARANYNNILCHVLKIKEYYICTCHLFNMSEKAVLF